MTDTQQLAVTLGGTAYTVALPSPLVLTPAGGGTTPIPPPAGTAPFPAALAGHALVSQYLPADLLAWQYEPGTKIPVTNGSGVSADPSSPRNVSVVTDGGVPVLKLAVTSAKDCGVIQSPGKYPTSGGVVEALVKFSGFTSSAGHVFADWASIWMYAPNWPAGGELDLVETSYGGSKVSYHYAVNGADAEATTDPWTYPAKKVQLSPKDSSAVPTAPNILPDAWTHVTVAFGKDASGNHKADVYYEGTLYCTVSGSYVTGSDMFITAGTSFGGPVLGSSQAPYDVPGSLELQYVRVFS